MEVDYDNTEIMRAITILGCFQLYHKGIHSKSCTQVQGCFLSGQTKQPFIRACFQARQKKGGISLWHFSTAQSVFFRLL